MSLEEEIRTRLLSLAEPSYQKFASSLIPGCENMVGVRIPAIRNIAKELVKQGPFEYLNGAQEQFFEETMLKALIIGNLREDLDTVLEQVTRFVPKITNWSICDSFCAELKITRRYSEQVWDFLQPYLQSDGTYEIRFAVVMLLRYYIDQAHLSKLFLIFNQIHHPDYYVKMAVAWAISMCYLQFPQETMAYLKDNGLDDETYHKALQKIRDSRQVDQQTKAALQKICRVQGGAI